MVGETGFEPATPWSRTASDRFTWRITAYDGELSRGFPWTRVRARIAYRSTDRIRNQAVWRAGGAARQGRGTVDLSRRGGRPAQGQPGYRLRAREVRRARSPARRATDTDSRD